MPRRAAPARKSPSAPRRSPSRNGNARNAERSTGSAASKLLDGCLNVADLEVLAKRKLPRATYDYYAGGAEDERTLARNRAGFERYALLHRVLVNVERVDTSASVLGSAVTNPVLVAPTAYQRLADDRGEIATARAAGEAGSLMTVSTLATRSLEEVAAAATGPLWFQLYVYRDRAVTERLIARAEAAGYRALVVTVDTPLLGRRERDHRNGFALPRGMTIANFTEDADRAGFERYGSLAAYASAQLDPSLTWESIEWFRKRTRLPIVLKGIVRADDARRAVDCGADGVWVSNHGGRQLDGCEASVLALPAVAEAVGSAAEVYVDGGIRRGSEVVKALALGARAVFVGRPILWGLAVGGERGVRRVLDLLREEVALSLALAGCADLRSADRSLVVSCA
ncbi:MAG TPA: alpha-hydroxy acid oxidase [Candidatus Binatia bacterium]|nr:alpha-hydroxy acid oxidase [Candidatus Binatia bacterium]